MTLNDVQLQQLALLAHGKTPKEAALIMSMTPEAFSRRLEVVRRALGAATTYEAVFLYATNYVHPPTAEIGGRLKRMLMDLANGVTDDCE